MDLEPVELGRMISFHTHIFEAFSAASCCVTLVKSLCPESSVFLFSNENNATYLLGFGLVWDSWKEGL